MRNLEVPHAYPEIDRGTITATLTGNDQQDNDRPGSDTPGIDPMTLAGLDIGLYRALKKIGTPKQRICSALCLSYAEYDYISKYFEAPQ